MKKSGLADSPFFSVPQIKKEATPLLGKPPAKKKKVEAKDSIRKPHAVKQQRNRDTKQPRNHETTVSRYHDTIIELVRKAVKELGNEAATHRFTKAEKKVIADIIYSYKNRGTRTSENEIVRIAVNFVIQDYKENGESSVLERALRALNG